MASIAQLAARAAHQAGIPPKLYVALITRGERSYKGWQTSPAGAQGPAQLMPGTASGLEHKYGIDTSSVEGNLLGGAYYLKEQLDHFKDPRLAVAAYNAGPGAVESAGGVPSFAETQRYVRNVMGGVRSLKLDTGTVPPPSLTGPLQPAPSLLGGSGQGMGDVALGALEKISMGWKPTELLPSLLSALPAQAADAPVDLRGHPIAQTMSTPEPGGGWGGSKAPALRLASIGERNGLTITSEKRGRRLSASGLPSDHWVGSKNAFAVDLGGPVSQMDATARQIASVLGVKYNGKGPLVLTKVENGLRYQILYRTNIGGDHFNHIHVGVKRGG